MPPRKYSTPAEARLAKNAANREWRARMKALGIRPQGESECFETRVERKERERIAKACATPFRDADAHERGGRFKHDAGCLDPVAYTKTDSITGDITNYRGTGFYAGRRKTNG